ncbi:hypothetical protein ACL9RF_06255 [Sphingobacterium sp. Mn56C]|uniref:hypothetical protein n=1 Tax=Sphingobacterium sp. Mn56C TaxID=3395261 RepID=UPI003BED152A
MRPFLPKITFVWQSYVLLLFLILLGACSQRDKVPAAAPQYAIFTLDKDGMNRMFITDSLYPQTALLEIQIPAFFDREYIQKAGYFYHVDYRSSQFIRYHIDLKAQKLQALDTIQLDNRYIEQFHWKNNTDTLLVFTVERNSKKTCSLFEIDAKNFKLIRQTLLPIPNTDTVFNRLNIGLVAVQNNALWLAYSFGNYLNMNDYSTQDTSYYINLDFKTLQVNNLQKDSRSTYPGGINTVQTYSADTENGDLYFMSCPGIALGNNLHQPTAIFRKPKNAINVDTNYMVNISKAIHNHAYGFWYIGNNKALIRSEQKDKFTDFANHHSTFQFEYFVLDLHSGKLHKLALPLDKGTRKENVLVHNNMVYISIDDSDDKHRIWQYSLADEKITEILSINKSTDYLLRMDYLK